MFVYAQLDIKNIVVAISELHGEVSQNNMIKIDEYDATLFGKKYNNSTKKFEKLPSLNFARKGTFIDITIIGIDNYNGSVLAILNNVPITIDFINGLSQIEILANGEYTINVVDENFKNGGVIFEFN